MSRQSQASLTGPGSDAQSFRPTDGGASGLSLTSSSLAAQVRDADPSHDLSQQRKTLVPMSRKTSVLQFRGDTI